MLNILFAAVAAAAGLSYSPAQLAEYRGQIRSSCEVTLKSPGTVVPKGFCSCFAKASAEEAMALKPEERAVFLLLTENAGDPIGAQRAAKTRLNMPVETFAAVWDKLNPIGQKAGSTCAKAQPPN
jgi:hypothetical protein